MASLKSTKHAQLGRLHSRVLSHSALNMGMLHHEISALVKTIIGPKQNVCTFFMRFVIGFLNCTENWPRLANFLSAAEGQRPGNYSSCCCSWIFRLIYALSTSTTVLPPIFFKYFKSICLSVCQSVCLSVCISIYLTLSSLKPRVRIPR